MAETEEGLEQALPHTQDDYDEDADTETDSYLSADDGDNCAPQKTADIFMILWFLSLHYRPVPGASTYIIDARSPIGQRYVDEHPLCTPLPIPGRLLYYEMRRTQILLYEADIIAEFRAGDMRVYDEALAFCSKRIARQDSALAALQAAGNAYSGDAKECVVCMDAPCIVMTFPCMHCVMCRECSLKIVMHKCPVCTAEIHHVASISAKN